MYDFVCQNCGKRFDLFMAYNEYGTRPVACVHCGSTRVRRRLSKVRITKSEESRMESMSGDLTDLEGLENDPQALGRMMRKVGKEMGEDLPPEFDDVVDRLESGQNPEEIESALPDLGGESSAEDNL